MNPAPRRATASLRPVRSGLWLVILGAALAAGGCTIFPHGAYWPAYDRHLAPPRAADAAAPAEAPRPSAAATGPEAARPGDPAPARAAAGAVRGPDRLREAIARRWSDEALADSARAMDPAAGRWVYGDTLGALVACYVDPITYRDLVVAGIRNLRAALDSAEFRARFPEAADDAKRARLADALDILSLKAGAAHPWLAWHAEEWLTVVLEKNRALLGLPDGAVVAEMLFGALDSLDPYTRFLTTEMLTVWDEELEGRYTGIGAEVVARDGRLLVGEVFEGGPAAAAGLAPGDEITAIDGEAVGPLALAEAARRLRGRAGTRVALTVRPGGRGEVREVAVERAAVRVPSVRGARLLAGTDGVGYLRLADFKSGTEKELRTALRSLAGQGATAVVLDLRDNPGGSLLDAVGVVGALVAKGRVVQTRGRLPGATWSYDVPLLARPAWTGPLAVLVGGETASAAEVVAAALASRGRAAVVGARTYGKGAVQIVVPVGGGASALCVTIARVYDPAGRCLETSGVAPDRRVARAAALPALLEDDPVVRAAVDACRAAAAPSPARGADDGHGFP